MRRIRESGNQGRICVWGLGRIHSFKHSSKSFRCQFNPITYQRSLLAYTHCATPSWYWAQTTREADVFDPTPFPQGANPMLPSISTALDAPKWRAQKATEVVVDQYDPNVQFPSDPHGPTKISRVYPCKNAILGRINDVHGFLLRFKRTNRHNRPKDLRLCNAHFRRHVRK